MLIHIYIVKRFFLFFTIILLVTAFLIVLFDIIELIRRAAVYSETSLSSLLRVATFRLLHVLDILLPFSVMLGSVATFWWLERSHELIIIKTAGFSVWQVISPMLLTVLIVGIGNTYLLNPLNAVLYTLYEQKERTLLSHYTNPFSISKDDIWLREAVEGQKLVLYASQAYQEGCILYFQNVSVFVLSAEDTFIERIEAQSSIIRGDNSHELHNVYIMRTGQPVIYHKILYLPTTLTVNRIKSYYSHPEAVSVWELPGLIHIFEESGFSSRLYRLHLYTLIASPFLLFVMLLIPAVFFAIPQAKYQSKKVLFRISGVVGVGFLFHLSLKIANVLGQSEALPIILAVWGPTIVAAILIFVILLYLEE